jgi:DNA-binding MarR family transcriptional regulator
MTLKHESQVKQLFRFIDRILFIEKRTRFQFKKVTLYPSEIHLILLIHNERATNGTLMAERLGVTKGAISQTLSRLEKKGILVKSKDPYMKNELTIEFLPLGKEVLHHYLQRMEDLQRDFDSYLSKLTDEKRDVIKAFLAHANTAMARHLEREG